MSIGLGIATAGGFGATAWLVVSGHGFFGFSVLIVTFFVAMIGATVESIGKLERRS